MSDNYVTGFYTKDGVKKYDYRALANLPESGTDITNTVISPNADYAEVGEWADGNPNGENRLGYFVSIAEVGDNTIKIRKATSEDDVRGVSVYNPAFSGNASKDKYGADGELLPQYNYIGVMGIVKIIDNGRCSVNGRCMPSDDGTAIPSTNNMGYAVLERVDERHVLIAVEPGADMIQRVKADIKAIEEQIENGDFGGGGSPTISVQEIEGGHRVTITNADGTVESFDVMDGEGSGTVTIDEVDASKVIFNETVYTGYAVGNITLENGKAVLAKDGDNLLQVMKNIWSKEINPTASNTTKPSVTITFNQAGSYEVGTVVSPKYSATFNKGKYPYDDDTGVTRTGDWSITDTAGNSSTSASGSFMVNGATYSFTVGDKTNYKITASTEHSAGIVPHSNMGNPYSAGRIEKGTASKASDAVTGYRNSFYGVLYDKNKITKDNIRGICDNKADSNGVKHGSIIASGQALKNGDSFPISIPESTDTVPIYGVFIAYPDDLKELAYIQDFNDSNYNILEDFGDLGVPEEIDVAGANEYTAIPYKVYIQYFANPYNASNKYTVKIKGDNE